MPGEKSGGGRELVLEDKHLFAVFLAVVFLCAVFFTLGFLLGRNQIQVQKAVAPAPEKKPAQPGAPTDLTFPQRVEGQPPAEQLAGKPAQPSAAAANTSRPSAATAPAAKTAGAPIYLQVAAVSKEADASNLARELEKLGFPAAVRAPQGDALYRVLVGPLENAELADAAQRRLEAHGFRQILRR